MFCSCARDGIGIDPGQSGGGITAGNDGGIIVPFHSDRSDVIAHTNTDTNFAPVVIGYAHMPLGNVSLPMNQVRTLALWINEGAKNDNGEVPFSYSPSGKIYIGQTIKTLKLRLNEHSKYTINLSCKFGIALKKYGFENFVWWKNKEVSIKCR